MSEPRICGACGAESSWDARFCGRCGQPLAQAPRVAKPPMRTMFAGTLGELAGGSPAPSMPEPATTPAGTVAAEARPPAADNARTMLGVPLQPLPGWTAPVPPDASVSAASASPPAAQATPAGLQASPTSAVASGDPTLREVPAPRAHQKTMLGVGIDPELLARAAEAVRGPAPSASVRADEASAQRPSPGPSAPGVSSGADARGPSAPVAGPGPAAPVFTPAAPVAPAFAPAASGVAVPGRDAAPTPSFSIPAAADPSAPVARPSPLAAAAADPRAASAGAAGVTTSASARKLGPSNRTMLGVATPAMQQAIAAASAHSPLPPGATPSAVSGDDGLLDVSIAGLPSPRRRGRGLLVATLGLGVLSMIGVVGSLLYWRFGPRTPSVRATVVQGEQGEMLEIEVPGAPAGSRARFAGAERVLEGGRARFPLAAESLHVGDNPLSIEVVAPSGAAETHRVTLTLELRVRADLAALAAAEPAITIVVEGLPGSRAELDGQPLPLDPQGRGSRAYPIAAMTPSAEGVVQHVVRWRVTPPAGQAAEGTLTTRVPLTTIQVDRPGADVVTDRDRIEIAGAVAPGSTVTIDGTPVPVQDGRFLHSFPLPQVGTFHPRIAARAPGRAPATRTLTIRRVADLAREAASFEHDPALTYARIAPAPAHFQGQRVAFEGRVYNVDVREGRSVLQIFVFDCPASQRCPLWVTYPAATDVTVDTAVRVLGTLVGEQQFRSESGALRTVPRVDATYVLPMRSRR